MASQFWNALSTQRRTCMHVSTMLARQNCALVLEQWGVLSKPEYAEALTHLLLPPILALSDAADMEQLLGQCAQVDEIKNRVPGTLRIVRVFEDKFQIRDTRDKSEFFVDYR